MVLIGCREEEKHEQPFWFSKYIHSSRIMCFTPVTAPVVGAVCAKYLSAAQKVQRGHKSGFVLPGDPGQKRSAASPGTQWRGSMPAWNYGCLHAAPGGSHPPRELLGQGQMHHIPHRCCGSSEPGGDPTRGL